MRYDAESSLKLFIVISVALHLAAGFALYLFAPEKKPPRKETTYIVRIVPPEPPPPVLDDRPPEALEGAPPSPQKKVKPVAPPKKKLAVKLPKPKPRAEKPPVEKEREAEVKEARGTAPQEEELRDKAASSEARAEGAGELPGKGEDETGKGKTEEAGPDRLFDPEVLSGIIAKDARPPEQDGSITFDTREIRYYSYMMKLRSRIEAVWEYPRKAAEEGIYGDLVIRFVIKKDGSLGAVELVRTSGWRMLDQAAMEALKDGAPYWPLPEEWGMDSLPITGHFIYTLYGYYYLR